MNASVYHPLFLYTVTAACFITSFFMMSMKEDRLDRKQTDLYPGLLTGVILLGFCFWIGDRPINAGYFGDTRNYALGYLATDPAYYHFSFDGEWVWEGLTHLCLISGLDVAGYFTVVAVLYVFTVYAGMAILVPRGLALGMLFVLSSLMFFSFCTNGLRNGLACHTLILGIALALRGKYLPAVILAFLAYGTHHSAMLPIAAATAAMLTWRIPNLIKYSIWFWIASIFISLAAGNAVTNFFASLGFDDRMSSYSTEADAEVFSHTGFRWDFLLYSAMPVAMAWYVGVKRNVKENWFTVLSVVYILCNAFWIMVIRASFSNRFAYLSWFIYPVVIAYPLIEMEVFGRERGRITGYILMAYSGFTLIMNVFYW